MHVAQSLDALHHRLRHLDLDANQTLHLAGEEIDRSGAVAEVEQLMATAELPCVSAVRAVPLPPVRAVLMTAAFLRYIGQTPNVIDLFWTLGYYWDDDEAKILGIAEWQRVVLAANPKDAVTDDGVGNLVRWLESVLLVTECPHHDAVLTAR